MDIKRGELHLGKPVYESRYSLKDVQNCAYDVVTLRGDPEVAHEMEDILYRNVLEEVAAGNPEARNMAKAALKTKMFDFPRWYA